MRSELLTSFRIAVSLLPSAERQAARLEAIERSLAAAEAAQADGEGNDEGAFRLGELREDVRALQRDRRAAVAAAHRAGAALREACADFLNRLRRHLYRAGLFIATRRMARIQKISGGGSLAAELAVRGAEFAEIDHLLSEASVLRRDSGIPAAELCEACERIFTRSMESTVSFSEELESPWPCFPPLPRRWRDNGEGVAVTLGFGDRGVCQIFGPECPPREQRETVAAWARGNACPVMGVSRIEVWSGGEVIALHSFTPAETTAAETFEALWAAGIFDAEELAVFPQRAEPLPPVTGGRIVTRCAEGNTPDESATEAAGQ